MFGLQRPKAGEDEEEILKQEREFFKNKEELGIQASTTIASCSKRKSSEKENPKFFGYDDISAVKKPKSRFALERETSAASGEQEPAFSSAVLGDIVERSYGDDVVVQPPSADNREGFPRAELRDNTEFEKGRSIFLQQRDKHPATRPTSVSLPTLDAESDHPEASRDPSHLFGSKSYVVSGEDSSQIHEENVRRLGNMTVEEIAAERERLMSQMDPELVRFLMSRRQESETVGTDSAAQSPSDDSDPGTSTQVTSPSNGDEMETESDDPSTVNSAVNSANSAADVTDEGDSPIITLPITADEMETFVHMNIVEEEKLKWTTELPDVELPPDNDKPYSARFDFHGTLLPYNDPALTVDLALHHHGDEPERPGYTLQELFTLTRSTVLQQRVVSLVTIANITSKAKQGIYDKCFIPALLKQLVEKKIFLLLRFSLDDSNAVVVMAAVNALRNLFFNRPDEVYLDCMLGFTYGLLQPSLYVEPSTKVPEELQEMKDHEVADEDLVRGALRTDMLQRLGYVLETLKPDGRAVVAILETLTRIARHSYDAAREIMRLPSLINVIVNSFLTKNWEKLVTASCKGAVQQTSLYGVPVVQAVRLLRIISSRSRQLASDLVHKHSVMESVVVYMTLTQETELRTRDKELLLLNRESFYLWQTFLSYNLATEHFSRLGSVLMSLLRYHWEQTDLHVTTSAFNLEHGAALIAVIEQVLLTAESQAQRILALSMSNSPTSIPCTLAVEDCSSYVPILEHCLKKWVAQLSHSDDFTCTGSMQKLVAATLSCLSSFYRVHSQLPHSDIINLLHGLEELEECLYKNFFANDFFESQITIHLLRSSNLTCLEDCTNSRDPPSLPSVGSLSWGGDVVPVVDIHSPVLFLRAVSNFFLTAHAIHRGLNKRSVVSLLDDKVLTSYVKYIIGRRKLELKNNWFTCREVRFLIDVVRLAHLYEPQASVRNVIFYDLAVKLVTLVQSGDRHLLVDVLRDIIFNIDFVIDSSSVIFDMKNLSIEEEARKSPRKILLASATKNLPQVWQCYEQALGLTIPSTSALDRTSLTVPDRDFALPSDWIYLPLLRLCRETSSSEPASEAVVETVTHCLSWALVAESLRTVLMTAIDVTSRFCRVSTVFLAGTDLFLHVKITGYLEELLNQFVTPDNLKNLDFSLNIAGLSSFYDLYSQLLEQFAAVSYGSRVFAQYLLVPLRQKEDISFRRQLWFEHAACLRVFGLPLADLPFSREELLWPLEDDPQLLAGYLRCLLHGTVRKAWSPVLYMVAVHHVAFFLYKQQDDENRLELQTKMRESLENPNAASALEGNLEEVKAALQECITEFNSHPMASN